MLTHTPLHFVVDIPSRMTLFRATADSGDTFHRSLSHDWRTSAARIERRDLATAQGIEPPTNPGQFTSDV